MRWINKEGIPGDIRLSFQLRGKLIGIPYAQKITIAIVKRIIRGGGTARRCHEEPDPVEADDITADIALGLTEKGRTAPIFDKGIADQDGPGFIVDDHGLKEASRDHVPFHTHIRFSSNVDPMIVVMDKIPDQDDLGIGKLHPRRLAAADRTVFDAGILDLLGEQHSIDGQPFEQHATSVE